MTCQDVLDLLPDWAAGRLARDASHDEESRVAAHLSACASCAAEAALLRSLLATRPEAPADLAPRLSAALRAQTPAPAHRSRRLRPAWALPAAAVLVLAIGTSVLRNRVAPTDADSALGEVAVVDDAGVWIAEDGMVAGAPVLEDLSDEALAALLEEMGG